MNTNELFVIGHPEFGDLRALLINGEPWFVGKEVASKLGYGSGKSLNNAVSKHVDNEDKGVTEMMTPGGMQQVVIINESGLYSLILSSKLESAKRFKRWVTTVVLPSIRKHGAYVTDKVLDQMDKHPEWIPEYIQRLRDEKANAKAAWEALEEDRAKNALLAPKATYYDSFVDVESLTNFRYTAKELDIPQKKFIGYLLEKGYVFRDRHRKGRLFARASERNNPLFQTKDFYLPDGTKSEYTLVTPDGKAHFMKKREKILAWVPGESEEGEAITEQAVFADNPVQSEEPR